GGYRLGRSDKDIHVAEIIDAVSESLDTTKCQGKGDCQQGETCLTHHLWQDLSDQIHDFLSNISLADLVSKREIEVIARSQQARMDADKQSGDKDKDQDLAPGGRHER